jgi:hypothetical protein
VCHTGRLRDYQASVSTPDYQRTSSLSGRMSGKQQRSRRKKPASRRTREASVGHKGSVGSALNEALRSPGHRP